LEELHESHPLEYERLMAETKAKEEAQAATERDKQGKEKE